MQIVSLLFLKVAFFVRADVVILSIVILALPLTLSLLVRPPQFTTTKSKFSIRCRQRKRKTQNLTAVIADTK
jgi:hypothetical protein